MLVLSRKRNESIVIGTDVVVMVVEQRGDKVRLGVVAPKDVPVHRQEVFDAIQRNGEQNSLRALERPILKIRDGLAELLEQHPPHTETGAALLSLYELAGGTVS